MSNLLSRFPAERPSLLPLLTELQAEDGFLSEEAVRGVAHRLGLTDNEVYGVASFYPWFRFAQDPEAEAVPKSDFSFGQTAEYGDQGVVVCNAARGAPGDVDRVLLESEPEAIVLGLVLEAKRLGHGRAAVWVDVEWGMAAERVARVVRQAEKEGIAVDVVRVPGALMHREGSAFVRAFEGWRPVAEQPGGDARIAVYTPEALLRLGTPAGEGEPKVFYSLSGSVAEPGITEAAPGTTVRQLLARAGGALPAGCEPKAFQAGGPLGEWLPASRLDEPAEAVGASAWGSGSLLFVNASACAVDLAARMVGYLSRHLCGKCVVCREGTLQLAEILGDLTEGRARAGDVDLLAELADALATTGSCALGRAAANPVLSTLRAFRDEYDAHERQRVCPAGRCSLGREG